MSPLFIVFFVGFTLLLRSILNYKRSRERLPPGPFPFPYFGNLPQLAWLTYKFGDVVEAMESLKKEYGPVFTLWMGPQPTVHIGSMEIALETMVKRGGDFVDRWFPLLFNIENSKFGITTNSGPIWHEQRRFALHTLRNFGFGKSVMEERIMAEFNLRADQLDIDLQNSTKVDSYKFFELMVGSVINRMLFSERFLEHQEKEFIEQKRCIDQFGDFYNPFDFLVRSFVPFMIPILNRRWNSMAEPQLKIKAFLRKQVTDRMEAIEKGEHVILEEPEDYVDAFLLKMKEEEGDKDSSFNLESICMNLADIWIAGQVTTVSTVTYGFAQLTRNPQVVRKIRQELSQVTKGRPLSLKDKTNTKYLNATITEIQRLVSLMNINFFRTHDGDTVVGGHPVADGVPITAELSLLMKDERFFKNPKEFNPSRFIEDPQLEQHVVPFGIGKRACLGEALARAELYLIIGNMIMRYDFETCDGVAPIEQINDFGVFRMPKIFKMRFTKINQ